MTGEEDHLDAKPTGIHPSTKLPQTAPQHHQPKTSTKRVRKRRNQFVAPSKNEPEPNSSGTRLHAPPLAGGRKRGAGEIYVMFSV